VKKLAATGLLALVVIVAALGVVRVMHRSKPAPGATRRHEAWSHGSSARAREYFSVSWLEGEPQGRYRLEGEPRNSGGKTGGVTLRLTSDDSPGRTQPSAVVSTERTDTWTDELWAEVDLVLPIRVNGEGRPQVLVLWLRSNWTAYELYAVTHSRSGGDEIASVFGFSCRYCTAIDWIWKNGELAEIVTYDHRYEAPERIAATHPEAAHWQETNHWSFDRRRQRWVAGKSTWKPFQWGEDWEHHHVITEPGDCPFVYRER
jgi:hypothetical protein